VEHRGGSNRGAGRARQGSGRTVAVPKIGVVAKLEIGDARGSGIGKVELVVPEAPVLLQRVERIRTRWVAIVGSGAVLEVGRAPLNRGKVLSAATTRAARERQRRRQCPR